MYCAIELAIWISSVTVILSLQNDCSTHLDSVVCEHNIPRDIPDGVKEVIVKQMTNGTNENITIHADLFSGKNWNTVEHLTLFVYLKTTITSKAFYNLKQLLLLAIHDNLRNIKSDGFVGLQRTEILDLSDCRYMFFNDVTESLNGSDKMPRLQELYLMNLDLGQGLTLDRIFFSVLASKNITTVDFSKTIIQRIDFDACFDTMCPRPMTFRFSKSNFLIMKNTYRLCSEMRMVDISYARLNEETPHSIDNVVIPVGSFLPFFSLFFHVESLIADGVFHDYTLHVHNLSFFLIENDTSTIQNCSISNNHLNYVDVKLLNFPRSLKMLNLSSNDMFYFQPNFLFANNSLTILDLSHNNLYEMAKSNSSDLGILLRVYKRLQHVYLYSNRLTYIPTDMFVSNSQLHAIDLSHNQLDQVEFHLDHNKELHYLNLAYNMITTLSELSLHTLHKLVMKKHMFTVDIRNNDIRCDTCTCKDFIQWILNSKDAVISDMICRRSDGNVVPIDDKALAFLNDMCQREKRMLIGTMVPVAGVILLVLAIMTVRRYLRVRKQIRTSKDAIKMIQEGQHDFRFVSFLAFSGEDEFFVEENVRKPLEKHLRVLTGTDREIICTGDRHFKLGCTIGAQTDACIRNCGSVVLIISPAFCKSPHCNNEMNVAYTNRKPIILMFKEHVEEKEMTPLLKVIFKQFTRVTWSARDGEFTLSTSWENICESLIDSMIDTKH